MKNYLFWILLFLLFAGCTARESPMSGTYPTIQIRGMWMVCFQSSMQKNNFVPPTIHAVYCDCMMDRTRKELPLAELRERESKKGDLAKFFTEIAVDCRPNQPQPEMT